MVDWGERLRGDPTVLAGAPSGALHEVLDEVAAAFDRRPWPPLVEVGSDRPIQVIGDSHGDYPAVHAALSFARRGDPPDRFIGLGDYVDRATRSQPDPKALPSGSVWNAAYLLSWTAHAPDEVILLRGNHEATRQLPVPGPTLLRELRRAYPAEEALGLWERLVGLLERLPLAARTEHGVFLAHGGIPPAGRLDPAGWNSGDLELLEGLLWGDPDLDYEDRSVGHPYTVEEFAAFLRAIGCRAMIKGHAPGHSGRAIYGGTLLTVHTSDLFATHGEGGVLLAEIPPLGRFRELDDVVLRAWGGTTWTRRPIRGLVRGAAATEPGSSRAERVLSGSGA